MKARIRAAFSLVFKGKEKSHYLERSWSQQLRRAKPAVSKPQKCSLVPSCLPKQAAQTPEEPPLSRAKSLRCVLTSAGFPGGNQKAEPACSSGGAAFGWDAAAQPDGSPDPVPSGRNAFQPPPPALALLKAGGAARQEGSKNPAADPGAPRARLRPLALLSSSFSLLVVP